MLFEKIVSVFYKIKSNTIIENYEMEILKLTLILNVNVHVLLQSMYFLIIWLKKGEGRMKFDILRTKDAYTKYITYLDYMIQSSFSSRTWKTKSLVMSTNLWHKLHFLFSFCFSANALNPSPCILFELEPFTSFLPSFTLIDIWIQK